MIFDYNGYTYWFSAIDACYYKQKHDSFDKIKITEEEFNATDEVRWERYK